VLPLQCDEPAISGEILNDDVTARGGGIHELLSLLASSFQRRRRLLDLRPRRVARCGRAVAGFCRSLAGHRLMVDCLESSAFSRDRLPAIAASVATVRRIVLDFMDSHCNADPQLRSDVALCVSEAAGNSIAHAFPAPGGAITLIISQVDQALTVEICDEGVGRAAPAQTPGLGVGSKSSGRFRMPRSNPSTNPAYGSSCASPVQAANRRRFAEWYSGAPADHPQQACVRWSVKHVKTVRITRFHALGDRAGPVSPI
jgi:anti-sigma regulatory factor (Ser/Thr protein kinase)